MNSSLSILRRLVVCLLSLMAPVQVMAQPLGLAAAGVHVRAFVYDVSIDPHGFHGTVVVGQYSDDGDSRDSVYDAVEHIVTEVEEARSGQGWWGAAKGGAKRVSSKTLRNKWEKETGQKWPKNPKTGRNQDVSHKKPLADGGTNDVSNIEPLPHAEHARRHSEAGDFRRWGSQGGKKE